MDIRRGIIRSYNAGTQTCEVEIVGSRPAYLTIPAASDLTATELTTGAKCAVLFFDETNPNDAVVLCTYDL